MTTIVYVGDMHGVVDELDECQRLVDDVDRFATEVKANRIVYLGDQFHNHSTLRVEVVNFWLRELSHARRVAMKGNHDEANDGSSHALAVFRDRCIVVDAPVVLDGVLYLPYMRSREGFIAACREHPTHTVVCHQLFDGSRYENGFYVGEEGVDPADIPQGLVISGHIHKPQIFGKVWYVGAPRWRIASDANEERRVYAVTFDDEGRMTSVDEMDTARTCRRIVHLRDTPEAPAAPPPAGPLTDVRVDVVGPTDYVRARAAALALTGCRVKTFRTDAVRVTVRESDGLPRAWGQFLTTFVPSRGTPVDEVRDHAAMHYGITMEVVCAN